MALLGYKTRFVEPLLSGQKDGTIRAFRKYPIKPGDRLYHYTGLRTKHCQKIGESNCISVDTIRIGINQGCVWLPGKKIITGKSLHAFARRDGFANWEDMKAFWIAEHGVRKNGRKVILRVFEGIYIRHTKIEGIIPDYVGIDYGDGNFNVTRMISHAG